MIFKNLLTLVLRNIFKAIIDYMLIKNIESLIIFCTRKGESLREKK